MSTSLYAPPSPAERRQPPARRTRRRTVATFVACGTAIMLTIALGAWPWVWKGDPGAAVVDGFPVAQARADLARVAAVPHPMGTAANADVRAFLLGELRGMGLTPQVQTARVTLEPDAPASVWSGEVNNIVARLAGTDGSGAVMLAAHYDSVPAGPGAGDNGAGVVAVLETMRVLSAGPPPRNDVIVVFADGEEHEMLGSKAFVDANPWVHDVRVVLNTEGAGRGGRVSPALTSPDNGWVLRSYVAESSDPFVYSAFDAPLNALHMGGDLERYQQAVPAGLEFATLDGLSSYHTSAETADRVSAGTLTEYGTTILALTRHLADSDLDEVSAPSAVAFTLTSNVTVIYPGAWSLPLALVAALAVIAGLALAMRRGLLRPWSVIRSLFGLGAGIVLAMAAATAAMYLVTLADPRMSDAIQGHTYYRIFWLLGAAACGVCALALATWWLRRRHTGPEVAAAALVGFAILAVLLGAFAPTVAYLVTWPLLGATAAFSYVAVRDRGANATRLAATAGILPAVLLVTPLVYAFFQLIARAEITATIPLIALPILFAASALALAVPFVTIGWSRPSLRPAAVAAVGAVVLLGTGVAVDRLDETNPRPDLLVYQLDADAGVASWVAVTSAPESKTGQTGTQWQATTFVPSPFHQPGVAVPALATGAPSLALDAPAGTVVSDSTVGDRRTLGLNAVAPAGTYAMTLEIRAAGGVHAMTVNEQGAPAATSGSPSAVRVVEFSPTDAGTPVRVTVNAGTPVQVILTAYTLGLPPQLATPPRPDNRINGVHEIPDATAVTSALTI